MAALTTAQIQALTTAQAQALTTAQVVALTTSQVAAMETADVAALKTSQVAALETADVAALTTAQIQALTTAQAAALTTAQAAGLTTAQVVALTTAQVQALSTADLVALSTAQVAAMETADVAALKTSQVAALETADVAALTTAQIQALTTAQAQALTTLQVESLTTAQIGAFTTDATSYLNLSSPIILDLNGDGVSTQSIQNGVTFDLFANGKNVNTGWVSSSDGLLVLDRNHDGAINDGSELFGEATKLSNGSTAKDGYAALRELDTNNDGLIDKNDAAFAELKVWVDSNSDGRTGSGELKSLQDLNISSISVVAEVNLSKDNGNLIGLTSTYQTTDGATHAAADVWFVADKYQNVPVLTDVVLAAPENLVSSTDLRTQVSNMAQTMSAIAAAEGTGLGGLGSPESSVSTSPATPTNLAVVNMANTMQQFDANGQLVAPSTPSAPPLNGLNLAGTQNALSNGVLAAPGTTKPG